MIRIAAVGDVHFAEDSRGALAPYWARVAEHADVFLLVGDLTNIGSRAQAKALADELRVVDVPMVAILGNHDFHADEPEAVRAELEAVGVIVLEGAGVTLQVGERTLGIAGVKGFGGGFPGACGHDFGEPEMKAFMRATERSAAQLERALAGLAVDYRVALTHSAPVKDTLAGERFRIARSAGHAAGRRGRHLAAADGPGGR